jgi:hypothetical protein
VTAGGVFAVTSVAVAPAASILRRVVEHEPFIDHRAFVGHQPVARCRGCRWAQVVDEDLHEDCTDALLTWHVEHPEHGLDYLAGDGLVGALQVPPYVRWTAREGLLDLVDERTGGRYGGYNHACLAVFRSAAAGRPLQDAVASEARRLRISPSMARTDVVAVAANMYQRGLLQPRPAGVDGPDRDA